jgi:hypothetical protein
VTQREKCEKLRRFDKLDFKSRGSEFEPRISLIQFKGEFLAITLLQYLTKKSLYVSLFISRVQKKVLNEFSFADKKSRRKNILLN